MQRRPRGTRKRFTAASWRWLFALNPESKIPLRKTASKRHDPVHYPSCSSVISITSAPTLKEEFGRMAAAPCSLPVGAGFLGYYLVKAALHFNHKVSPDQPIRVTVWDSFIRGRPAWLDQLAGTAASDGGGARSDRTAATSRCRTLTGSFTLPALPHPRSIASTRSRPSTPTSTGCAILLDWSVRQQDRGKPIKGFLFYSSSEIYGDPSADAIPTREDYRGLVSCTGPRACYDESKRFGETLCVVFAQEYGIPSKMARPFNNYGPGLKITDKRVIPDFARDIFAGRDLVMYSDGKPTRTFCYSADSITGYYKVLVKGQIISFCASSAIEISGRSMPTLYGPRSDL